MSFTSAWPMKDFLLVGTDSHEVRGHDDPSVT